MSTSVRRAACSAGATLFAAASFGLVTTGVAVAHVTANPGTAVKGSYAKIAFRVPDEAATAGTVKLQVTLPIDHPIASVRTEPMPGWTAQITTVGISPPITDDDHTTITRAPHVITWTAQPGVRLGPTEFAEFTVSMGALPGNIDRLVMPAVQTYDDGTVVNWDQVADPSRPDAPEPEHPAPTVRLVDGSGPGNLDAAEHGESSTAGMGDPAAGVDHTARWLGGVGLALGALGLGLGAGAVTRVRRVSSATTSSGTSSSKGGDRK
jgi:periplasmic copper chaperone A